MAQELTIIALVDIQAALDAGTLDGNIYLIDNLRTEGSENEATGNLISAINGSHWFDGSQASEQLINWLPYGISSLPPTLPRFYLENRIKKTEHAALKSYQHLSTLLTQNSNAATMLSALPAEAVDITPLNEASSTVISQSGTQVTNDMKLMNVKGHFVTQRDAADDLSSLTYLTPQIYNITGEAVDKGVIYPAQYGTPAPVKGGWYWCAGVNTYLVGTYSYTLHMTLFRPETKGTGVVWVPVNLTYDATIKVTSGAMKNGFTGAGLSTLPVV